MLVSRASGRPSLRQPVLGIGGYGIVCLTDVDGIVAKIDRDEYGVGDGETDDEMPGLHVLLSPSYDPVCGDLPSSGTLREIACLEAIARHGCRGCMRATQVTVDPEDRKMTVFMPRYQADLKSHIRAHGPLRGEELRIFARSLFQALHDLHTRARVLHRDVKPDNIFIRSHPIRCVDDVALSDYSLCCCMEVPGTTLSESMPYGEAADVSSAALLMVFAACGSMPSWSPASQPPEEWVREGMRDDPVAREFISCIMWRHPEDRMSTREALKHPYIATATPLLSDERPHASYADEVLPLSLPQQVSLRSHIDVFRNTDAPIALRAREYMLQLWSTGVPDYEARQACVILASKVYSATRCSSPFRARDVYETVLRLGARLFVRTVADACPDASFYAMAYDAAMSPLFVDIPGEALRQCLDDCASIGRAPELYLPPTRTLVMFCKRNEDGMLASWLCASDPAIMSAFESAVRRFAAYVV